MKLGMVGLGRMGANMAERLRRQGHEVVGFDPKNEATDVPSLAELVTALEEPGTRVAWVMVPSGDPTESTVSQLVELFEAGDVIIEGGNSNWNDSVRRNELAAAHGIGYVDCGTSGGIWGLDEGYCLMVGGDEDVVARVQPVFDALAPEGGFARVGGAGTGHFTKMIHNGIEYGLMQSYAEGYAILEKADLGIDALAAFQAWRHGSVVRSWLLDLLVRALEQTPDLEGIRGIAADSGEGRWTVNEAVRLGVAAPVISAALFARFTSQLEDNVTMKVIAALRQQFGGHAIDMDTRG